MGTLFSGSEIIDIAIGIENNGAIFYETLAESAKEVAAQSIYKGLASMERAHIRTFEGMRASIREYKPEADLAEEYHRYLKALVDSSVFKDDETVRQIAESVSSDAEAIQVAISAEKDSVLFYSEMRNIVPESQTQMVDRIIEEEKTHLRKLSELKEKLTK